MAWNWNVPGAHVTVPNTQQPLSPTPQDWASLSFDPVSAYDLRRHLGVATDEAGRFMASCQNFLASDVAYLAAGASEDGQHAIDPNSFFPEFDHLRDVTPLALPGNIERKIWLELVWKTIFDLIQATKWDRSAGITTMILHVEGATIPGAPLSPEYMKAHVYIPPSFLAKNPASHDVIASIVQSFIQNVGILTAAGWTPRRTSYYVFRGRPAATVLPVPPAPTPPAPPALPTAPVSAPAPAATATAMQQYDIDDIDYDPTEMALFLALERNHYLEGEVGALTSLLHQMEDQRDALMHVANEYEARDRVSTQRIIDLQADVSRMQRESELNHQEIERSQRKSPIDYHSCSANSLVRPSLSPPMRSPHPPLYISSPAPSTSQAPAPSLHAAEPGTPRGASAATRDLGPITREFLIHKNLQSHHDSLCLICRMFSPLRWAAEIDQLTEFPQEWKEALLLALEKGRPQTQPRAPLTAKRKKEKREESEKEKAEMDNEIQAWMKYTHKTAGRLAERFDKAPRYFLDIFSQGGACMVHTQEKVNTYNVFKSEKTAECRENGEAKRVPDLHKDHYEEYQKLTDEEKAQLVKRFTETRFDPKIRRATPRARVQDVSNTVHNIQMLASRANANKATQSRKPTLNEGSDSDHAPSNAIPPGPFSGADQHSQCDHHHSPASPADSAAADISWNFDFGNELPDSACEEPDQDHEPDLDGEVVEALKLTDENALMAFSKFLSDAQEEARSAERVQEKGLKRLKHYTNNSKKTQYRNRKKRAEMEAKGFKNVFDFMKAVKKKKVEGGEPVETVVDDSSDESGADEELQGAGSEPEAQGSSETNIQGGLADCMDPVNLAHVRLRELLEGLEDPSPESGVDRALNQLNYTHFPALRRAVASLTVKSKDKNLDVFFRARITAMMGALNLYLDAELSYSWREASMIVSKSQGHSSYRARSIRSWIHTFLTSKKLPLHRQRWAFHCSKSRRLRRFSGDADKIG
ncbi:hypothetical protein DFH09DRAFT_1091283 [Mycena vulgaris]|nr:hypothetical protein DFH09DRAFT_1091283 [Mycena vulgaris]